MEINVSLVADPTWSLPLAVAVRSLLDNASSDDRLTINIIEDGFSRAEIARVSSSWDLGPHVVHVIHHDDPRVDSLPVRRPGWWSSTNYVRLLIGSYLPTTQRTIYLDADVLVLSSLQELASVDLGDHVVAAVTDPYTRVLGGRGGLSCLPSSARADSPYFNAGVMVINLDQWRDQSVLDRCLDYLLEHAEEMVGMDQEALNYCAAGEFTPLDVQWNVMNYWTRGDRATGPFANVFESARVRHFEGSAKPWTSDRETGFRKEEYFDYVDRTVWRGWRPPQFWPPEGWTTIGFSGLARATSRLP